MKHRHVPIASALTALPADAAKVLGPKEQCFGIAKAGQNDWEYEVQGSCEKLGGSLTPDVAREQAAKNGGGS